MEFYGHKISKCHIIINKRKPVMPGYRLLSSSSTKLKLKDNYYQTSYTTLKFALNLTLTDKKKTQG